MIQSNIALSKLGFEEHLCQEASLTTSPLKDGPSSPLRAILAEAKRRQSLLWILGNFQERTDSASKEISDMMKGYGWNRVDEGHQATSHSGRKTCVSAIDACTEGRERSALKEWMLVTDEILVTRYCERDYEMTEFTSALYDWF